MRISPNNVRWAALLGVTVALTVVGPVAGAREPQGVYRLGVTAGSAARDGAGAARATLTCRPDGGSHPRAAAACKQLGRARGDIAKIPAAGGMCTTEYAPVRVRADGRWNGRARRFERTFSNRCVAVRETGGVVFRF
ncbi:hypothetical protein GCM10010182_27280 [Actinomadura cremea]|nr:hypothetical protein GCM10010182_27280 [Actinomadura cremea]